MKILQIHNEYIFYGGEDTVVANERNLLEMNGHIVHQLIRKNKSEANSFFKNLIVVKNLFYSLKSRKIVLNKLYKFKPDIVHVHNIFPLWSSSIIDACYEAKIPVIMTLHNFRLICANGIFYTNNQICEKCINQPTYNAYKYNCYQESKIKSFFVAKMIDHNNKTKIYNKVSNFIVLTNFSKTKFIEANFPKEKLHIKPNFVKKQTIESILDKKKNFIYASRLSKEKGLLTLLKAHQNFTFDLTICGDGPLKKNVLNHNKTLNYIGPLSNKLFNDELINSKCLILPSVWYEGFPMLILEAFAAKTLVLASNLGSLSSIITDRYNGLLFEPNNHKDLIKKIQWITNNKVECDQIIINAKNDFLKKYTERHNYKTLINIYEETIKKKKFII